MSKDPRMSSKYRVKDLPLPVIETRVTEIVQSASCDRTRDSERLHAQEDQLLVDFIAHVATAGKGASPALLAKKARAVMKVRDSIHARWCS